MITIKYFKNKYLIIFLILLSITLGFSINIIKDKLIINEIKTSYKDKADLTKEQIEEIESVIKNKNNLNPDRYFMLGYLNLFVENNKDLAYDYFEKVIEKENLVNIDFVKVYSYKFLAEKYIDENNIDKAIKYTEKALYSINPKHHGEYRNLINDIARPVIDLKQGRDLMVKFLEYILVQNYKHPDIQAEFYAYRILEEFYLLQGNYYASTYASINALKLANELNKQYFSGTSLVNLARIYNKLGYTEKAMDLLDEVKYIKAEDDDWHDKLNLHRLRASFEVMMNTKDYESALHYLNEFDKYKSNIEDEIRQDIEIIQNISKANISSINDDFSSAQMYLDRAKDIMDIDKVVYWTDKDIYYYISCAYLNEQNENYKVAIDHYKKARTLAIERSSIEFVKISVTRLKIIYENLESNLDIYTYDSELNEIHDYEEQKNYERYMNFLSLRDEMQSVDGESKRNKFVNTVLIFIILVVVIFIYKFNIYPWSKYVKLRQKVKSHLYNNNYEIHYQPIVNPKKNEIVGFEGLLRLKIKDKLIMPSTIISEIEKSNMMGDVSIWILNKIVKDYKVLKTNNNLPNKFYISMNISLKEIEDDKIIDKMIDIINKSQIDKDCICIEITENVGLNNIQKSQNNLFKLKQAGVLIAIDDFGVEHSNFSIINTLIYDIVKIDKTFINDIVYSPLNKDIINFCDTLFNKKDKTIVIEGVEEIVQAEFIKNTKSEKFYIQGYFYSKPRELDDLIDFKI